ncbi:MAG: hypothetical protein ACT4OW_01510 [Nitrososphaerota archaeon]
MKQSKTKLIGISVGSAIVAIILAIVIPSMVMIPDYRVEVDAIKVQDVVQISNVRITNTGKLVLTDLKVDFGQGDIQVFNKLEAGKTIWVSPKASSLTTVTITTHEGITLVKDFREPMSMVAFGPG